MSGNALFFMNKFYEIITNYLKQISNDKDQVYNGK